MFLLLLAVILSECRGVEMTNLTTEVSDRYGADMLFTPKQLAAIQRHRADAKHFFGRKRRMVSPNNTDYWPEGVIPFEIDSRLDVKQVEMVRSAMQMWTKDTCLHFVLSNALTENFKRRLGHNASLLFTTGTTGCTSFVGRYINQQRVELSSSYCTLGTIIHELGHAIGFGHEHSRPDRDQFITLNTANIKEIGENFNIVPIFDDLGIPYDLGSVMHYGGHAFAKDRHVLSIRTKDPLQQLWIGQDTQPSFLDIKTVNMVYACNKRCGNSIQCKQPSYVGPNCKCICPDGFHGERCDQIKQSGCGGILTNRQGYISSPGYPHNYKNNEDCYWLIKGALGSRIRLTVVDFKLEKCIPTESNRNCDHLDVRIYGNDRVGQRYGYICPQDHRINHNNNELVLHFKTDGSVTEKGFMIFYQII